MAGTDYDRSYRPYGRPAYRNEVVVPYSRERKAPPRCGGVGASAWFFSDPEMKRRRRVASYKAYSVEGKVKASLRNGFRWIKAKCSHLIHRC